MTSAVSLLSSLRRGAFALVLALGSVSCERDLAYVNRVTGFGLGDVDDVQSNDDGLRVALHLRISAQDLQNIRHRFWQLPAGSACFPDPTKLPGVGKLRSEYRVTSARKPLLLGHELNAQSEWIGLLNPETRQLWITIAYPDRSGDPGRIGIKRRACSVDPAVHR